MENIVSDLSSNLSKMWTKIKNIENSLFPELQEQLGILSSKEEKLIKILDFAEIEKNITVVKITNTPKDREEMARSFIAKSVYNLQTTRDLIDRLKIDRTLRVLCGWRYAKDIPSEAKFSRVFDELSELRIAQKTHQQFIQEYLFDTIFMYSASDATAIEMRQKAVKKDKVDPEPKRKRGRPKKGEEVVAKNPTILQKQQEMTNIEEMLSLLSTKCNAGVKKNSKGNKETWVGGKLHISAVDGDIPVTAIFTSASVHDSSVALPLIKETSGKLNYLYDLLDAGYDADIIREYSRTFGHRPIIDINPKNSKKLKAQIALVKEEKEKFTSLHLPLSSDTHHYNQRSMVERVNKYLKDDFGCDKIYYQGASKVASVLQFGILSVCIHQSLKLVT
ncbi:MAG: IS5/IS1182 family transposase [Thermoplasmata archaeon]|nr:MAG: IS5/IS1182 family transposase [Thermoplasmata archaeon]